MTGSETFCENEKGFEILINFLANCVTEPKTLKMGTRTFLNNLGIAVYRFWVSG